MPRYTRAQLQAAGCELVGSDVIFGARGQRKVIGKYEGGFAAIKDLPTPVANIEDAVLVKATLDLEAMTKVELEQFARDTLGLELDRRRSAETLREEVRAAQAQAREPMAFFGAP
jgi:hypothetical protein